MARSRGWRDEQDKSTGSTTKDSSISLSRLITVLIIFVAGVIVGLTSSSHIDRHFTFQQDQLYMNFAMAPMPASTTTIFNNCSSSVVSKCEKEKEKDDCLSMDRFLSPKNLTHGMSDEELFWRASMMPKKAKYPYDRVPKVAFMFLTRGPLPMMPLWERFFKGHEKLFSVYVHALPGYELNVSTTSAFYGRQIPSQVYGSCC